MANSFETARIEEFGRQNGQRANVISCIIYICDAICPSLAIYGMHNLQEHGNVICFISLLKISRLLTFSSFPFIYLR